MTGIQPTVVNEIFVRLVLFGARVVGAKFEPAGDRLDRSEPNVRVVQAPPADSFVAA